MFAAGCFWGIEMEFSKIDGVISTKVGYTGGDEKKYPNPTYEEVCSDKTGFAEAVEVIFDKDKVGFSKLLGIFWKIHDPTQKNRQGPDIGTQYRSAIFYTNEGQKKDAEKSKLDIEKKIGKKVATEIVKAGKFFPAEEYHQRYLEKRGLESCRI